MKAHIVFAILGMAAIAGCTAQSDESDFSRGSTSSAANNRVENTPADLTAPAQTVVVYNFTGTIVGASSSPVGGVSPTPSLPAREDRFSIAAPMSTPIIQGNFSGNGAFRFEVHASDGRVLWRSTDIVIVGPVGNTAENGDGEFFSKPAEPGDYSFAYYVNGQAEIQDFKIIGELS